MIRLLPELGFRHERAVLGDDPKNAVKQMPNVRRVFSLLRRWMLGTYQGACHPIHLQSYLDEFIFRFNRRRSANRWLLFERLLERAALAREDVDHVQGSFRRRWTAGRTERACGWTSSG